MFFKDINLSIYDYFWTDEDYTEVMVKSGFKIVKTHNPLGKKTDGYNWINEDKKSHCTIYVAKKG